MEEEDFEIESIIDTESINRAFPYDSSIISPEIHSAFREKGAAAGDVITTEIDRIVLRALMKRIREKYPDVDPDELEEALSDSDAFYEATSALATSYLQGMERSWYSSIVS